MVQVDVKECKFFTMKTHYGAAACGNDIHAPQSSAPAHPRRSPEQLAEAAAKIRKEIEKQKKASHKPPTGKCSICGEEAGTLAKCDGCGRLICESCGTGILDGRFLCDECYEKDDGASSATAISEIMSRARPNFR